MGYEIIGFGTIEVDKFDKDELKEIKSFLDEENYDNPNSFTEISVDGDVIYFKMSGNKQIDYEPLEKIKREILKLGSHPFQIMVNEYMECCDGFYFDTEEIKCPLK